MLRDSTTTWVGRVWDRRPGPDYLGKFKSLNAFAKSIDGTDQDENPEPDKVLFQSRPRPYKESLNRSQRSAHVFDVSDKLEADLVDGTMTVSHYVPHPEMVYENQELFTEFKPAPDVLNVTEGARSNSPGRADWSDSFQVDRKTGAILADDPFADNWFQANDQWAREP